MVDKYSRRSLLPLSSKFVLVDGRRLWRKKKNNKNLIESQMSDV
jgi:hypothetical protein